MWLSPTDFRRRFLALLSYQFSAFSPPLALNIIQNRSAGKPAQPGELSGMAWTLLLAWLFVVRRGRAGPEKGLPRH